MKAQLTVEEMVTPAAPTAGETAINNLDENEAHLHMADESAAEPEPAIYFKASTKPRKRAPLIKESLILLGLTLIFTSAFWLLLCYLRNR